MTLDSVINNVNRRKKNITVNINKPPIFLPKNTAPYFISDLATLEIIE